MTKRSETTTMLLCALLIWLWAPTVSHAASAFLISEEKVVTQSGSFNGQGVVVSEEEESPASETETTPTAAPVRTCAQTQENSFCRGAAECFTSKSKRNADGKFVLPGHVDDRNLPELPEGQPGPDAQMYYDTCYSTTEGTRIYAYWRTAGQNQQLALAQTARAQLPFPKTSLAFSPNQTRATDVTVVNTPTYWWIPTGPTGTINSPRAGSMQAHATPTSITINPGDGSPAISCPWTATSTTPATTCTYTYPQSSITGTHTHTFPSGQTQPAYQASATITWTITFTSGNQPRTFPTLPPTQTGQAVTTVVPVTEIQSLTGPQQ